MLASEGGLRGALEKTNNNFKETYNLMLGLNSGVREGCERVSKYRYIVNVGFQKHVQSEFVIRWDANNNQSQQSITAINRNSQIPEGVRKRNSSNELVRTVKQTSNLMFKENVRCPRGVRNIV